MQDTVPDAGPRLPTFWLLFGIILATLAVYLPAFQNSFVNLDDYAYITSVAPLSWANVRRIFTGYFEGYHPLSMLSLGLTYHFCGVNPWPYHCTNVLLHLANTVLVFVFVSRLATDSARPRTVALVAALLFGIHPVHVEAVAWVTSRKDVLYSFLYLLSLVLYLRYLRTLRPGSYVGALLLTLLAALSKGMAASMPLTLLTIDFLHGRRLRAIRTIVEKIPFFAVSALFGAVSVLSQQSSGYMPPTERLGVSPERATLACRAFILYLRNLFAPHRVAAFHPYPAPGTGSVGCTLLVVLLILALAYCSWKWRSLAFGGLFFVSNIVLVTQLLPVADFIIADRYNYMSSIGIFFAVGLLFERIESRARPFLWCARAALFSLAVALAVLSFVKCRTWKDSITVWTDVLSHYPDSVFALNMRGCARSAAGDYESAIADFSRAAEVSPAYARSYTNRGYAKHRLGNLRGAESDYTVAITLKPRDPLAHNNRGLVRHALGNHHGALADYTAAIELARDPRMILLFHSNRAIARLDMGEPAAAVGDAELVLRENPDHYRARLTRAKARIALGDREGALDDLNHAIGLAPEEEEPRRLKQKISNETAPHQPSPLPTPHSPSTINH